MNKYLQKMNSSVKYRQIADNGGEWEWEEERSEGQFSGVVKLCRWICCWHRWFTHTHSMNQLRAVSNLLRDHRLPAGTNHYLELVTVHSVVCRCHCCAVFYWFTLLLLLLLQHHIFTHCLRSLTHVGPQNLRKNILFFTFKDQFTNFTH